MANNKNPNSFDNLTVRQHLDAATDEITAATSGQTANRERALAKTHIETAIFFYNRARAIEEDQVTVADFDRS